MKPTTYVGSAVVAQSSVWIFVRLNNPNLRFSNYYINIAQTLFFFSYFMFSSLVKRITGELYLSNKHTKLNPKQ